VIAADLWKIGQVKPGEVIAFRKVSLEDARSLFRSFCHFLISLEGLIK
jgi:allophanate hydrolase subunit 2